MGVTSHGRPPIKIKVLNIIKENHAAPIKMKAI